MAANGEPVITETPPVGGRQVEVTTQYKAAAYEFKERFDHPPTFDELVNRAARAAKQVSAEIVRDLARSLFKEWTNELAKDGYIDRASFQESMEKLKAAAAAKTTQNEGDDGARART